jgi:hypothetical protein
MNLIRKSILIVAVIMLVAIVALAADNAATYLIMGDIPPYYRLTQAFDAYTDKLKTIPGYTMHGGSGMLAGADHFLFDHSDITYETTYQSDELDMGMSVQITQHSGSDSDKWLMHEVDSDFRSYYGIPTESYSPLKIDAQTILDDSVAGETYRWISGNKVIEIKYRDLEMTKPEPLEVVKAYLAKHPSTIPAVLFQDL